MCLFSILLRITQGHSYEFLCELCSQKEIIIGGNWFLLISAIFFSKGVKWVVITLETLVGLAKLLFDGLAIIVIMILYIKAKNKMDTEKDEDRKELREINETTTENYNQMIKDIVQAITKKHLTPEESKSLAYIDKQINDIINIILKETNASRVCLVKYHNGNKDMMGKSFLKMSMTNEVVNVGVAPMIGDFKDVFRSLLAYWCHELEEKSICVIEDAEQVKDKDITMYQYLVTRHINSKYGMALKDNYGNIIGFMCIEFLDKEDFDIEKITNSVNKNFPKIQALTAIDGGDRCELQ